MTTSLVPLEPFEVSASEISDGTFAYFCSRNRMRVFSIVNAEFERSGITQAELAKRMKKGADRISRLLGAPGNWTNDTASELLLAISGAQLVYSIEYPMALAPLISAEEYRSSVTVKILDPGPYKEGYTVNLDGENRHNNKIYSLV